MKILWCSVAKSSRSKNVSPPDRRSDANLSRGIYLPLERREIRNESMFPRLHGSKRRSNVVDDEMSSYPASEYERMHQD